MTTYREIILSASKRLDQCPLADLLNQTWKKIEWSAHEQGGSTDAALSATGDMEISLFPPLRESKAPEALVLREFGRLLLQRAGGQGASIWDKKLDLPTEEAINQASSRLGDAALRARCGQYTDVLDAYPDRGHSVDRLVYVNIVNALLANNISYSDSEGVDIKTWGPTAEYCNLKKYHSLIPLVSAYAPAELGADFGSALAALVIDGMEQVQDKSVAYALRGIVQRIVKQATG